MKIEALREFVIFAKYLNFSIAAKELFLSQPTLSVHIAKLEQEVGITLIKHGNPPQLTAAGRAFFKGAQNVLEDYEHMLNIALDAARETPAVRLFMSGDNLEYSNFLKRIKGIPFDIVGLHVVSDYLRMVEQGTVDVGILVDYSHSPAILHRAAELSLVSHPIGNMQIGFAVMDTHPLSRKKTLTYQDLARSVINVYNNPGYDEWFSAVLSFIEQRLPAGERLHPKLQLLSSLNPLRLSFDDFGDAIEIASVGLLRQYLSSRNDVVLFEEIEGEPVTIYVVVTYQPEIASGSTVALVEQLCKKKGGGV